MSSKFPVVSSFEEAVCFRCGLPLGSPIQASGHPPGEGEWRGECTAPQCRGRDRHGWITYFDVKPSLPPSEAPK